MSKLNTRVAITSVKSLDLANNFRQARLFFKNYQARKNLKNHDFSIISNNCWGGQVYKDLGKPYNTPFVGLFLHAPCYIQLLENLDHYLSTPLKFTQKSKYPGEFNYPIGLLYDIEVHFVHYANEEEAFEKWNRRLKRLSLNNLFIKFCDRDLATSELIIRFDRLKYRKVFFSSKKLPDFKSLVWFSEFENEPTVDREMNVYKKYFNVVSWLNSTKK